MVTYKPKLGIIESSDDAFDEIGEAQPRLEQFFHVFGIARRRVAISALPRGGSRASMAESDRRSTGAVAFLVCFHCFLR